METIEIAKQELEPSWQEVLSDEFKKDYFLNLLHFLKRERASNEVYPPEGEVFQAFNDCPFEKTKVVIMGQDPYHGPNQAHGLSFSVKPGISPPPSLKNIYKEIENDLSIKAPSHGCLSSWSKQGVLMLNATLTVRRSEPKSHYGQGWELFTDAVIKALAQKDSPLVFLLWGRSAKEKCQEISKQNRDKRLILEAAHPSPYSARKGFFFSKHFSKSNDFLLSRGQNPIDWQL